MHSYFRYMNPTAVIVQSSTTTIAINSSTNNNYLSFPANMSSPNHSSVGVLRRHHPSRILIHTGSVFISWQPLTRVVQLLVPLFQLSRRFVHHSFVSNSIASYSIAPNGTIISNSIAPNGILSNHIVSHSIAPNGTIVSNRIAPNGIVSNHIVSHSIAFPVYSFSSFFSHDLSSECFTQYMFLPFRIFPITVFFPKQFSEIFCWCIATVETYFAAIATKK